MLRNDHPISEAAARNYPPLTLAYLGDAVYELLVRESLLLHHDLPHGMLNRKATDYVSARGQSDAVEKLLPVLTETETALFKRGRNSDATGGKNVDVIQYKRATGLETLFGYLYLCGQTDRLETLFSLVFTA